MRFLRRVIYYSRSAWKILRHFTGWLPVFFSISRNSDSKQRTIQLRKSNLQFIVRSAMDIWSIKETFLDEFYTNYGVPIQDGWTVVDIGAGIGDFSIYAAYGHPDAKIYAFDPFPGSHELLIRNLKLNSIENVTPLQRAFWHSDSELSLEGTFGEPLQISSRSTPSEGEPGSGKLVHAVALGTILDRFGIEKVDLIKLDCEGAEYDILLEAPTAVFGKIERITMEYHDLDSDQNNQTLIQFLKEKGYTVQKFENAVHDHLGYLFGSKTKSSMQE